MKNSTKHSNLLKPTLKKVSRRSDVIIGISTKTLLSIITKKQNKKITKTEGLLAEAISIILGAINNHTENDIALDFGDFRQIMKIGKLASISRSEAKGENAATEAMINALNSTSFNNASGVLVNFEINPNYPLLEIVKAIGVLEQAAHQDAEIIFGTQTSEDIALDFTRITIIATGFEKENIDNIREIKISYKTQSYPIVAGKLFGLDLPTIFRNEGFPQTKSYLEDMPEYIKYEKG